MNQSAARPSRPAGTKPASATSAPMAGLDFDDIEETTPSTPYPCVRLQALSRWFYAVRSWLFRTFGLGKRR